MASRLVFAITVVSCLICASLYCWRFAPPQRLSDPCPSMLSAPLPADRDNNLTSGQIEKGYTSANRSANVTGMRIRVACQPERRLHFIAKVYGLTILQLATSSIVAYVFVTIVALSDVDFLPVHTSRSNSKLNLQYIVLSEVFQSLMAIITFMVLAQVIVHRLDTAIKLRWFEALAVVNGFWLGMACLFVPREIVCVAVALTCFIFGAASFAALTFATFGVDLGLVEPILLEGLHIALGTALLRTALGLDTKGALAGAAGIGLWSSYILFDSSRIARKYSEDEYITGALDLYLDVLNLLLEVLDALMKNK